MPKVTRVTINNTPIISFIKPAKNTDTIETNPEKTDKYKINLAIPCGTYLSYPLFNLLLNCLFISLSYITYRAPATPKPNFPNEKIITPAKRTPHIQAITLFLNSKSKKLAANVPVQAPVPGSGIPTNNIRAI